MFLFDGFRPDFNGFVEDPSSIRKHFSKISQMLGVELLPPEDLIHFICTETIKDNPDKAIECFQVNVTNYPASYNALNALAHIYASKGMREKAAEIYEKSLKLRANNPSAIKGLQETGGK